MKHFLQTALIFSVVALSATAYAKKDRNYQDAVPVSFHTVSTGVSCYKGDCDPASTRVYEVEVGGQTLGLSRKPSFTHSVLHDLLPGAHVQASIEGNICHISSNGKETDYRIVEAGAGAQQ